LNIAGLGLPEQQIEQMGSETLHGWPGQHETIAPALVFLASAADSGFATGETIAATDGVVHIR
jgi:NAD(P)-dependent dehydrogenase (short-subunit alcohol dehydrogenase family)